MSASRRHELAITTAVLDGSPATIITIDGVDLLELEQPFRAPSQRLLSPSPQRVTFRPPDPVDLLPPDSMSLLPTALPRAAMVGICGCGTAGCDSLWLQVRRSGGHVRWEPHPTSPRATIDTSYVFDLEARAWPGHDRIVLTVATPNGVRQLEIPVTDDLTDDQILHTAHDVEDARWI